MICGKHGHRTPEQYYQYDGQKPLCKECIKERNRNRYKIRSEEIKARVKKYTEKNREKISTYKSKYREYNLEAILKKQKEWYQANREHVMAKNSKYYHDNRDARTAQNRKRWHENADHFKELHKQWRSQNKELLKQSSIRYRARLRLEAINHYSKGTNACASCGDATMSHLCLDHLNDDGHQHRLENPKTRGQSINCWAKSQGWPEIFQVLCYNCNYLKHLKTLKTLDHDSKHSRYNARCKERVMTHYSSGSPKCVECECSDLRILTIDHKDGGGRKHMNSLGLKGGLQFYKWIEKQGFPDSFQVLCFNCNCSKNTKII